MTIMIASSSRLHNGNGSRRSLIRRLLSNPEAVTT